MRVPLLGALIGRLPIAALSLATIILVRRETGSFAIAGAVEAASGSAGRSRCRSRGGWWIASARRGAPAGGRSANPLALIALVLAAQGGAGPWCWRRSGRSAGATIPAWLLHADAVVGAGPRCRAAPERLRARRGDARGVLHRWGPLSPARLAGRSRSPAAALLANAVFSTVGTLMFAASRASPEPGAAARRGATGPARCDPRGGHRAAARRARVRVALGAMEISTPRSRPSSGRRDSRAADRGPGGRQHGRRPLVRGSRRHHDLGGATATAPLPADRVGFAPLVLIGSMAERAAADGAERLRPCAPAGAVVYMLDRRAGAPGHADRGLRPG